MSKTPPGAQLAEQRRIKGWTQEELAEKSGVSSRTIQRIESGAVAPQAYTLKLLAASLDIDFRELVDIPQQSKETPLPGLSASKQLVLAHLLPLGMIILPGANILFPLLWWILKKDEYEEYDIHGRAVLNFQLTMLPVVMLSIILMVFWFPVGFPLFVVVCIYALAMPVLNAVWVATGKRIRYPLSIPFLKRHPGRNGV